MLSVFLLTTPLWGATGNQISLPLGGAWGREGERTSFGLSRWSCLGGVNPESVQDRGEEQGGLRLGGISPYLRNLKQGVLTAATLYGGYWLLSQGDELPFSLFSLGLEWDYKGSFSQGLIPYESSLSSLLLCALGTALTHSSVFLMLCSLLSLTYQSVGADPQWLALYNPPSAREAHSLSVVGSDLYLFGGLDGSGMKNNELWRYGTISNTWEVLSPTGDSPSTRYAHTLSVVGSELYLFGGTDGGGNSMNNDLWRYGIVSNTWEVLSSIGGSPSSRYAHTLSVVENDLYLFGGSDGGVMNDLWGYGVGNNTWVQLSPIGELPSPRQYHALSVVGSDLYLFGGVDGNGNLKNDLWRYGTISNTWEALIPTGDSPSARYAHTLSVLENNLYLFGGMGSSRKNDLWRYEITSSKWKAPLEPSARALHTLSVVGSNLYLFGGIDGGFMNDLWRYGVGNNTWVQLSPTGELPSPRQYHALSVVGSDLYLFGGLGGNSMNNDLWRYGTISNTWEALIPTGDPPSARYAHTLSVLENNLYLFGGVDGNGNLKNDLWRYETHGDNWTQMSPNGPQPSARYLHALSVLENNLYLFGGVDGNGSLKNDLWRYGTGGNAWEALSPTGSLPSARYYHALSVVGSDLYLLGGADGNSMNNDLWRYGTISNKWEVLVPPGNSPSARYAHALSVLENNLYLFGGFNGGFMNDFWILQDLTLTPTSTPTSTFTPIPTFTDTQTLTITQTNTNTPIVTKTPTPTTTATITPMVLQDFPPLLALKGNQMSKELTQRHIWLKGPLWYQALENTCPWLTINTAGQRFVLDGSSTAAGTCQVTFKATNEAGEEVRGIQPVVTPLNTRRGHSFSDIKRALKNHEKSRRARNHLT